MSIRQDELDNRAKAFIDTIININRKHGMGEDVPDELYESTVREAADAFRGLVKRTE